MVRPHIFYNSIGQERWNYETVEFLSNRIIELYEDEPPKINYPTYYGLPVSSGYCLNRLIFCGLCIFEFLNLSLQTLLIERAPEIFA